MLNKTVPESIFLLDVAVCLFFEAIGDLFKKRYLDISAEYKMWGQAPLDAAVQVIWLITVTAWLLMLGPGDHFQR